MDFWQDTERKLTKAIEQNPQDAKVYLKRAEWRFRYANSNQATLEDLNQALLLDPHLSRAYFLRASVRMRQKRYDDTFEDYAQALSSYLQAFRRGYATENPPLYKGADYHEVIFNCGRALAFGYKATPQFYYSRGLAKLCDHDADEALADFTRTLHLNPQHTQAIFYVGLIYLDKRNNQAAIDRFTEALQLVPDIPEAYFYRGVAYSRIEESENALLDFDTALKLDPDQKTDIYYWCAEIKHHQGELEDAITDYDKSLEIHRHFSHAYLGKAITYLELKNWTAAIENFTQAINFNHPCRDYLYLNRGYAYISAGNFDAALADTNITIRLNPQIATAYNNRACIHNAKGNLEQALADCNRAIELDPNLLYAYGSRGHTYFLMGQHEDALTDFQKALEIKADHPFALAGRAITLHALDRVEEAKTQWKALIELDTKCRSADALKDEYTCAEAFVDEAHKLVMQLSD